MAGLGRQLRRQVRAESRLRFGPARRQIREQAREVDEQFATDVSIANETARGAKRTARAVKPTITKSLSEALAATQEGPTPGVSAALGNLGPAAARDSEGAKRRLAETLAMATTELDQRVVDAEAGRASALRQASAERAAGRGRLRDQMRGVAADAGTFRQGRAGELRESARDRALRRRGQDVTAGNNAADNAQSERNSKRSAGIDPDTGKPIPGGKLDPKAAKPKATPARQEAASAALELARTQIRQLRKDEKLDRGALGPLLVKGRESATVEGEVDGKPVKIPVPGVKSVKQFWASVALDIEFDGQISQANLKKLRALGYGANMLGVGKYKPKSKAQARRDGDKAVNRSPGSDRAQG